MSWIATYRPCECEIVCIVAKTTKNATLETMYHWLKKNGDIGEFESGWGEYEVGDPKYRVITQRYFVRNYRKLSVRFGFRIKIARDVIVPRYPHLPPR